MDFRHNLTAGMGKETPGLMEDNPETEMETEEDDNDDLDTQPHHQGIKRSLMISRCKYISYSVVILPGTEIMVPHLRNNNVNECFVSAVDIFHTKN